MADRTIKPDSGNDLVLQNNGGGTKIEIPNSGDIEITGSIGSGTFNGIIGTATFPAGSVVGHTAVQMQQTTQVTKSGTTLTELDTDLRLTYTAKSSSNKLLFQVYAWFCSPNSNHLSWSYIYNVTDSAIVNSPPSSGSRKTVHWAKRVTPNDANDYNDMNYLVFADAPSG